MSGNYMEEMKTDRKISNKLKNKKKYKENDTAVMNERHKAEYEETEYDLSST